MITKTERIAVTTEKGTKKVLEQLALEQNTSVSKIAADMINFALEVREDVYLDELAIERTKNSFTSLSHSDIWK